MKTVSGIKKIKRKQNLKRYTDEEKEIFLKKLMKQREAKKDAPITIVEGE